MEWMAWTPQTAGFFIGIGLAITGMTIWELLSPTSMRQGWLPMATTRGDRFFISLLLTAIIHLLWLGLALEPLWLASLLSLPLAIGLMRWG